MEWIEMIAVFVYCATDSVCARSFLYPRYLYRLPVCNLPALNAYNLQSCVARGACSKTPKQSAIVDCGQASSNIGNISRQNFKDAEYI